MSLTFVPGDEEEANKVHLAVLEDVCGMRFCLWENGSIRYKVVSDRISKYDREQGRIETIIEQAAQEVKRREASGDTFFYSIPDYVTNDEAADHREIGLRYRVLDGQETALLMDKLGRPMKFAG